MTPLIHITCFIITQVNKWLENRCESYNTWFFHISKSKKMEIWHHCENFKRSWDLGPQIHCIPSTNHEWLLTIIFDAKDIFKLSCCPTFYASCFLRNCRWQQKQQKWCQCTELPFTKTYITYNRKMNVWLATKVRHFNINIATY